MKYNYQKLACAVLRDAIRTGDLDFFNGEYFSVFAELAGLGDKTKEYFIAMIPKKTLQERIDFKTLSKAQLKEKYKGVYSSRYNKYRTASNRNADNR